MVKRILLSLSTVLIATVNANAATTFSIGDNYMSASNLALNQSTAGLTTANTADTLNDLNCEVKSDFPIDDSKGFIVGLKFDNMAAATTTSINNNSLALSGGMQFYTKEGHYLAVQGRIKGNSYSVANYSTIGLGGNVTGVYNFGNFQGVGVVDYDSPTNTVTSATSAATSYNVVTTTFMIGGSPWTNGNVYVGPSVSMLSNSTDSIVSGLLSVSQKMGNVTGSLSYVYQSKGAATGNLIMAGLGYTF